MTTLTKPETVREAVGVFQTAEAFQGAIDALLSAGFDRADLSLLAAEHAVDEKLGHRYRKVAEAEDDPSEARCCYVSTESRGDAEGGLIGGLFYVGAVAAAGTIVASGGTLAAAVTGAALLGGTGGLVGAVLARLIDDRHARQLQERLDSGGLLLWVRLRDQMHETRALEILRRQSGHDVHVHDLPVG